MGPPLLKSGPADRRNPQRATGEGDVSNVRHNSVPRESQTDFPVRHADTSPKSTFRALFWTRIFIPLTGFGINRLSFSPRFFALWPSFSEEVWKLDPMSTCLTRLSLLKAFITDASRSRRDIRQPCFMEQCHRLMSYKGSYCWQSGKKQTTTRPRIVLIV